MTGKKQKSSPDYSPWIAQDLQGSEKDAPRKLPPALYIVATPIGNLGDITLRALHTLAHADVILSEDTRVTGALLHHYGLKKPMLSYHDHNAEARQPEILDRLASGHAVALVSDAGTPLVSDPGYRLVQACRAAGHTVTAIPGASALLTALASAGLPTDRFLFAGFPPAKRTARRKMFEELLPLRATLVFYESPTRLLASLDDLAAVFGANRPAAIARELTKLFEEIRRGSLAELIALYRAEATPRGEITILLAPPTETPTEEPALDALLREALAAHTIRDAVTIVTAQTNLKKSDVYARALMLREEA